MARFRFEDLEIWKDAIDIAYRLLDIADMLDNKKMFGFANQLRNAAMSISNNIAEGSGSRSKKDFINFLNIAKRSTFENANILILLQKRNLVTQTDFDHLIRSAALKPRPLGRGIYRRRSVFALLKPQALACGVMEGFIYANI